MVENKKNKIAVIFPHLHEFGGGEIFCEYMVNFLSNFFQIDLFYYKNNQINKRLKIKKNVILKPVKSKFFFINFFASRFISVAQLYLIFFLKRYYYKFIFSAGGEFISDKNTVIQYIHHPFYSLNPNHYLALGLEKKNFFKIFSRIIIAFIARIYFFLFKDKLKKKVTITNSKWTKDRYLKIYSYENDKIHTIYPTFSIPKYFKNFQKKFEKRNNDFVILGRVSRDKKIIEAVNFFIQIKKDLPNIGKLHIIGPISENYNDEIKLLKKKINKNKNIIFYNYLKKRDRNKILKKCKYGLNFSIYEHFGRSVLEMHKFGIIPLVHNSGGQKEIIVDKQYQTFKNFNELKLKISHLISNKKIRYKLINKYDSKFIKKFNDFIFKKEIKKIFLKLK